MVPSLSATFDDADAAADADDDDALSLHDEPLI
jgi:hypothetical protein